MGGRIGWKGQGTTFGDVVGGGSGRDVGSAVVDGDARGTGSREGHIEVGVDRRAGIAFGHGDIVDGVGRSIVVDNGRGDLLLAGLDAVGDGGNIHDDRLVHFVNG